LFGGDITSGRSNITSDLLVEGRATDAGDRPSIDYRVASPTYFKTMGVPLVSGRFFEWTDQPQNEKGTPLVVVINEAMARKFWPSEDPLGKRIKVGQISAETPWLTIVGVVGNVRHFRLEAEPRPEVYRPYLVNPMGSPILVIRAQSKPENLITTVSDQLRAIDPTVSLSNFTTMSELLSNSVAGRRFSTLLVTAFGAVALVLAAVGIYGVMAFSVMQRTHEIGIRMALGAQRSDVLQMVVRQGMWLTLLGVMAGLAGAFALTRIMSNLLFAVRATDPVTFVSISGLLIFVALLACFIPARRAMKVNPITALREP
jgi:predicted permease